MNEAVCVCVYTCTFIFAVVFIWRVLRTCECITWLAMQRSVCRECFKSAGGSLIHSSWLERMANGTCHFMLIGLLVHGLVSRHLFFVRGRSLWADAVPFQNKLRTNMKCGVWEIIGSRVSVSEPAEAAYQDATPSGASLPADIRSYVKRGRQLP